MDLQVQKREKLGKSVGSLRKQGLIPAELYGHGIPNEHLAVDAKEFRKVIKEAGESTVLQLIIGKDKRMALIHDIQADRITEEPMHIDFYQVRMDEKTTTHVALEFIGESPAVKGGGILNRTMTELEVEALPADLPHNIQVDISTLIDLNQSIYVKDIKAPKGVEILVDPETVIVSVTPPMKEEPIEQPVADVSEVKVETEEKKAERDKEKEATKE